MTSRLLKYEIKNIIGNFFIPIFGIVLPIFMGILITNSAANDIPKSYVTEVMNSIVVSISIMIPLSISLIGYCASYATEVEKKIPLRLKLFGISYSSQIKAKVISQFILVLVSTMFYLIIMKLLVKEFVMPSVLGFIMYIAIIFIITVCFIMIAHSIADIIGKFSASYGIIMGIYFFMLFISGNLGLRYDNMPSFLKKIALLFPTTYLNTDGYKIWIGKFDNYSQLIQSIIFLVCISLIILFFANYKRSKNKSFK